MQTFRSVALYLLFLVLKAMKAKVVKRAEHLLHHKSNIVIKTSSKILELSAKRGCEKKAPFSSGRNSVADAVILESFLEFLSKHKMLGKVCSFSFVSSNTSDFCDPKDKRKPHPQLRGDLTKEGVRLVRFSINIADEINWIIENLRPPKTKPIPADIVSSFVVESGGHCANCKTGTLIEAGLRGGMWYLRCSHCGIMIPVEDYVD